MTLLNDISSPDFPSILNTQNYFPHNTSHSTIYIITGDGLTVFEMDLFYLSGFCPVVELTSLKLNLLLIS